MEKLKKTAEDIQSIVSSTECDARTEIVLTEILAGKLTFENIYILPIGTHNRPFKKDLTAVKVNDRESTRISFHTTREGLYDYLPKGLFFPLHDNTTRTNAGQMTANVKRNKTIDENARKFFAPFDSIFGMVRVEAERQGRSVSDISGEGNFGPLGVIWELPKAMNLREKSLLIMLLPFSRTISSKADLISGLYSLFFNVQFKISEPQTSSTFDSCLGGSLNDCHLGYSSVLSGEIESIHTEVIIDYELNSQSELNSFAPGSRNDQMLDYLNGLFVPADAEIIKQPNMAKIKNHLILDDDQNLILGYSSHLQE